MNRGAHTVQPDPGAGVETGKRQHDQFALADDLLQGADAIADYTGLTTRQVYHQRKNLPLFTIGTMLCARKSTLLAWIAQQEQRGRGEG